MGDAFSLIGTTRLAVMRGRQNTAAYLRIMEDNLLPFFDEEMPVGWIYQQDNAPIHVSESARSWFHGQGVRLMVWPSRSPDLNPMENIWGWLARRLYANNRQFNSVSDLQNCVLGEREQVRQQLVRDLVESMHKRTAQVLQRGGFCTYY